MSKLNPRGSSMIYAIMLIVIGILLALGGVGTAANLLKIALVVIGVIFIAYGIVAILAGALPFGIIEAVLGIIIIIFDVKILWIAYIVLAIVMILSGISNLTKKLPVLPSLLQIGEGVLILLLAFGNRFAWSFVNVVYIVIGVIMIINGVLLIIEK